MSIIVIVLSIFLSLVLTRECATCGNKLEFDGSSHGIVNMGSFLVGHDVLRDYLYLFLTGNR